MRRARLGRTNLEVTRWSLWGIPLSTIMGGTKEDEIEQVIHAALDSGINLIDTSRIYMDSETNIGKVMKERRKECFLATKSLSRTRDEVLADIEESLKELTTSCALILGDNIFYGHDLSTDLQAATRNASGATIFAYPVHDPERYGVIEFDKNRKVLSIEEKPKQPKSRYAQTGFAVYDNELIAISRSLKPSARGELELTDINLDYLSRGKMNVVTMGRGVAWLDTGTHDALLAASMFIETIETRQGLKVACPEEIAYRMDWIDARQVEVLAAAIGNNPYARYLRDLLREDLS